MEQLRKTERGKAIYEMRKHAMRYTHHRGLAAVTRWVRLKYVAMNLKKLAEWSWKHSFFLHFLRISSCFTNKNLF